MDYRYYLTLLVPPLLMALVMVAIRRNRTRRLRALAERLQPEAAARGWTLETEQRGYIRVLRWSGTEDGVRWIAEAHEGKIASGNHRRHTSLTVWRAPGAYTGSTATLLMGLPDGTEIPKSQPSEGVLASLALKAVLFALDKGIDFYFGKEIGAEVDARDLKRVEDAEARVPGFVVMSSAPSDASWLIARNVAPAVNTAINAGPESLQGPRRPWILFWSGGVALGRVGSVDNAADLEPFVRAGVAIARAAR